MSDPIEYEYDVALSFAGVHRPYVEKIADRLDALGVSVFFDAFSQADAWGENLYEYFDTAFRETSRYVIAFVSAEYAVGKWTRHELQSAQVRDLAQEEAYILPIRMDDSEIPGLRSTTAYLDARVEGIDRIIELILYKIRPSAAEQDALPRTEFQIERLIATKPMFWEYLLFAGILNQEFNALNNKWRDHRIGLIAPGGPSLSDDEVVPYCTAQTQKLRNLIPNLDRILLLQGEAFGPAGVAGDADAIRHFAKQIAGLYEQLLDWALETRSINVPRRWSGAILALSLYANQPIEEMRLFRDRFKDYAVALPGWMALPEDERESMNIELTITFRLDDDVTELYLDEVKLAQGLI